MQTCLFYAQELLAILYPKKKPDSKLSEQAALAAVCQACDEIRKVQYFQSLGEGDIIPNGWLSYFENLPVIQDGSKFYTTLPAIPIALPNERGIRRVWPTCEPDNLIIPVMSGFRGMYRNSGANNLGGRMGYYPQGNKVVYLQNMKTSETVDMALFASALSLGEDARFPADDSITNTILERAVQIWGVQKQIPEEPVSNGMSA